MSHKRSNESLFFTLQDGAFEIPSKMEVTGNLIAAGAAKMKKNIYQWMFGWNP
jgi:hypothetical protein